MQNITALSVVSEVHQQGQGDLEAGEVASLPANWKLARDGC